MSKSSNARFQAKVPKPFQGVPSGRESGDLAFDDLDDIGVRQPAQVVRHLPSNIISATPP